MYKYTSTIKEYRYVEDANDDIDRMEYAGWLVGGVSYHETTLGTPRIVVWYKSDAEGLK